MLDFKISTTHTRLQRCTHKNAYIGWHTNVANAYLVKHTKHYTVETISDSTTEIAIIKS